MGRIKCIILRKDRSKATVKVNADKDWFRYKQGIYNIDREAVNNPNPIKSGNMPELIYMEGDPRPIGSSTDRGKMLDQQVIENAVKHAGEPSGLAFEIIADYLRCPDKLFKLGFILVIFLAILMQMLGSLFQ